MNSSTDKMQTENPRHLLKEPTRHSPKKLAWRRRFLQIKWASARVVFLAYVLLCAVTIVPGFITAPLMTWYFFGNWRFWRYLSTSAAFVVHAWRMIYYVIKGENGYMFSVPLTSRPASAPIERLTTLNPAWPHGDSCHTCNNCCIFGKCPVLDKENFLCRGYNAFFWRYFNCGRFPSSQAEIEYYDCGKWEVVPQNQLPPQSPASR